MFQVELPMAAKRLLGIGRRTQATLRAMSSNDTVTLPGGLVLREGRPDDLAQIGELLAERGEPEDAVDHRLVVADPALGWESCAVVIDGDRVVSTATLLDETLRLGDVVLPAGQVELVATATDYEGRGLVRALMQWAHERSAARGHVVQVMIGIPYFYRLFGYCYAIDIPRAHQVLNVPEGPGSATALRRARASDVAALAALQDTAQSVFDVAMPHPEARWGWLVKHDASTTWVLERDDHVVGSARIRGGDGVMLVAEAAAVDEAAARSLLAATAAQDPASTISVVHRPGTVTGRAWQDLLGTTGEMAEQYYVRLPDPAVVLDRLRPVLARRLAAAGLDRVGKDIVVSTFGRHYRIPVQPEGLGPVQAGGPLQGPGEVGGAGVAPDHLPAMLFGQVGIHGLCRRHPDVYPGPDGELFEALFPPVTADLLTYYLPY